MSFEWSGTLKSKLRSLGDSGRCSDLTIIADKEEKFKVHRLILSLWSPFLEDKISQLAPASSTLVFHEIDRNSMQSFLNFIYIGEIADDSMGVFEKSFELLKTAIFFQCVELVDLCAQFLKSLLTEQNATKVFETALNAGHESLIINVLDFINKYEIPWNGEKILESNEFQNLPLDCVIKIIQQDDLKVSSELKVFGAVHRWGTAECQRQKLDAEDPLKLRTVLDKLIKWIRFPRMSADEYYMHVAPKRLLRPSELDSLLRYFMTSEQERMNLPEDVFIAKPRNETRNDPTQESNFNKPHLIVFIYGDPEVKRVLYDILPNDTLSKLKEMLLEKFKYPICRAVEGGKNRKIIPYVDCRNPKLTLRDNGIESGSSIYLTGAGSINDKRYCPGCFTYFLTSSVGSFCPFSQ